MCECELKQAFSGKDSGGLLLRVVYSGLPDLSTKEPCRGESTLSSLRDSWRVQDCAIAGPHLGPRRVPRAVASPHPFSARTALGLE